MVLAFEISHVMLHKSLKTPDQNIQAPTTELISNPVGKIISFSCQL